ncbi:hypothetical protein AMECASPLE_023744, partial [Ameca splendens]
GWRHSRSRGRETGEKVPLSLFRLLHQNGSTSLVREAKLPNSKMAHRFLVRRIWTLSVKDARCLPSSTVASASFSTSLHPVLSRVSFLGPSRSLAVSHTPHRAVSFSVQDNEDFTERVINSDLPVLVDFHAQ